MSSIDTYKVCLIGSGFSGKTTFVQALMTGSFETKYVPTLGVEVHPILFDMDKKVRFTIWDCAGQERFSGLKEGYYVKANAFIIMCDLSSKDSCNYALTLKKELSSKDVPIIIVGNKDDLKKDDNGMCDITISIKDRMSEVGSVFTHLYSLLK